MSKYSRLWALALAGAFVFVSTSRAQFASAVISYETGTGFATGFTNATAALGAPASGGSVTPFAPPSSKSQIVSIGAGGEITLQLSAPITHDASHPYGLDLALFANQFFISSSGNVSSLFYHAATVVVQVSSDDSTWYTLNPALAPQAGELYPTDGSGNPTIPVNPSLTLSSFTGQNLAGIRSLYGGSAGGTAYDLAWAQDGEGNPVTVPDVDYVQIDVNSGVLDLDAVSAVPEPHTSVLVFASLGILAWSKTRAKKFQSRKSTHAIMAAILVGMFAVAAPVRADTNSVTLNFAGNPLTNGWQVFGDTNLFNWDSTNQVLDVTWDSSQSNSFFYIPLGMVLTKNSDFCFSFDLTLSVAGTGDSTGPLNLGIGFLNLTNAIDPGFQRGAGISPNIAEFDYYPSGYFPGFPSPATATPGFVDDTSSAFAPDDLTPYEVVLPTNVPMHIVLAYTACNQTATLAITTNGIPLAQFPPLVINDSGNGGFTATNDYEVDIFSITSYSEAGQYPPYVASIYAQGTIGNVIVTLPPPVQNITGSFTNGNWQTQFGTYTNWLYTLERSTNLLMNQWDQIVSTNGNGNVMTLQDTNAPATAAFYRVHASQP